MIIGPFQLGVSGFTYKIIAPNELTLHFIIALDKDL